MFFIALINYLFLLCAITCAPISIKRNLSNQTTTFTPTFLSTGYSTQFATTFQPTYDLVVNVTLNFSSSVTYSTTDIEKAVTMSFQSVLDLSDNFIAVHLRNYTAHNLSDTFPTKRYICTLNALISATSYSSAQHYEKLLQSDIDLQQSVFTTTLTKQLSNITSIQVTFIYDIDSLESSSKKHDTITMIIWFLGASAICAILALISIMCWRRINSKKDESKEGINLDFLLNPNNTNIQESSLFSTPMHIQQYDDQNDNNNNNNNKTNNPDAKKPSRNEEHGSYFQRLDDVDINNDHSLINDVEKQNDNKQTRSQNENTDDNDDNDDDDENPYMIHNFTDRDSNLGRM